MNFATGEFSKPYNAHTIGVRPEHLQLSTQSGTWRGVVGVGVAEHLGSDTFLHIHVEGIGLVTARVGGDFAVNHGDQVFLTPNEGRVHRFNEQGMVVR